MKKVIMCSAHHIKGFLREINVWSCTVLGIYNGAFHISRAVDGGTNEAAANHALHSSQISKIFFSSSHQSKIMLATT